LGTDSKRIYEKKKKIAWRIFPSYILITVISLVAVSWYASKSLRNFFLDQTLKNLEARAKADGTVSSTPSDKPS
jgi:hypothetical protein